MSTIEVSSGILAVISLTWVLGWLINFRIYMGERPGIGLGKLMTEGMLALVVYLIVLISLNTATLYLKNDPISPFTRTLVLLMVALGAFIQGLRFTLWWNERTKK